MRKLTWCEPEYRNGYWSVRVIEEFVPGWFQRVVLRKKPWTMEHTYTNICTFRDLVFSFDWREQPSGNAVGGIWDDMHYMLTAHVDKFLQREKLEKLQEQEIKRGQQ